MNRRSLILSVLAASVAIAVVALITNLIIQRARPVSFKVDGDQSAKINIYKADDIHAHDIEVSSDTPVEASFVGSQTTKLKPGSYQAVVENTRKYQAVSVDFVVPATQSITIAPVLSERQLNTQLRSQRSAIEQAVSSGITQSTHRVSNIRLYIDGTWAGVTLIPNQTTNLRQLDWQHIVLKKTNGKWRSVTRPAIVLDSHTYPSMPKKVLNDLNQQQYIPEGRDQ